MTAYALSSVVFTALAVLIVTRRSVLLSVLRKVWHYTAVHVRRHTAFAVYATGCLAGAGWIVWNLARILTL